MLMNSEELRKVVNSCVYKAKSKGCTYEDMRFRFILLLKEELKKQLDVYSDLYFLLG